VYRYGGEEFLVMIPEPTLVAAAAAMNRLRAEIEALEVVTISVGIAVYEPASNLDALVKQADAALYVAKSRGRNRVVCVDELAASAPGAPPGTP
jgi:diguanylate cyclase (GGDEF)-like protein